MRTNEERVRLVHKRTQQLKQNAKRKKQRVLYASCMAACLLLIVGIGAFMPEQIANITGGNMAYNSGTASLIGNIGNHAVLGYILMGVMAFLLGVCVTVLLYRLRRASERRHREDKDDKL